MRTREPHAVVPAERSVAGERPQHEHATSPRDHSSRTNGTARRLLRLQCRYGNRYVQRLIQAAGQAGEQSDLVSDTLSATISSSLGGGSRMDPSTQASMQRSFGTDFSHVRIHTDGQAAHLSRALGAHAFTVGRDIYFGSGEYSPGTDAGKHLLAHELTHTIQQGRFNRVDRKTMTRQQSEVGPGIAIDEKRPEAEPIQMQIQRSTSWAGATVHEVHNKAADSLSGDAPVTWQMLNGTMLKTEADADSSVNLPTISTSGTGTKWNAQVDSVPNQEGDGLPSDDAVYKANRRHEDRHVADDKVAFEATVVKWDKRVEKAKTKGSKFKGTDAATAEATLWAAMGGTPQHVARKYRTLSFTKGGQFHATPTGGPMSISNAQANADCSTSSIDVTNPS